jgi:hypothetical protein
MSPLRRILKEFTTDIEGARKTDLEIIHPFPVHPAIGNPFKDIVITEDRNSAVAEAQDSLTAPAIYTDSSARNGLTGHAVVWNRTKLPINLTRVWGTKACKGGWAAVYETAALRDDDNKYATELRAIRKALRILRIQASQTRRGNITILTDCQSAMKSLRRSQQQSGQYIIEEILKVTAGLHA